MNTKPPAILPRLLALAAILALAWFCLHRDWTWAFFFATLIFLTDPIPRAQLFRPARKLASLFALATLAILAVPFAWFTASIFYKYLYETGPACLVMEGICVATLAIAGFVLHWKGRAT